MNWNCWDDCPLPPINNADDLMHSATAFVDNAAPSAKPVKNPRIRVRAVWTIIDRIKKTVTARIQLRLRESVFGHYLDIESVICESPLLLCVARHQAFTENPSHGICYMFGNDSVLFTPLQFCVITGLRFGEYPNVIFNESANSFKSRIFPGKRVVKQRDLNEIFTSDWSNFSEDDCLRICLLMIVGLGFKGTQSHETIDMKLMNLVDDLEAWNHFPWGSYLWESTYSHVYDMTRRHVPGNAGFNLPGCVWPFKMWILEIFPEFKQMEKFYKSPRIPRFLSWGPGTRLTITTVERILETAKTNDLYRPILDVSATSDERQCEWYRDSEQYLRAVGILNQPVITRQPSFETMHTIGNQKPKDCFGDGFQCFGSSFNMNSAKESKKRRSVTISGFQYSIPDEIQTFLVEEFKSILDNRLHANNPRLSQLIKSDLTSQKGENRTGDDDEKLTSQKGENRSGHDDEKLTSQKGENRSGHDDEKVEDDLFENYNDAPVYHVPTDKMQPSNPPGVKENRKKKKEMQTEDSADANERDANESTLEKIKSWYESEFAKVCKTDLRLRRLGTLMGGEVGPDFWMSLMGDKGNGWLSDDHLYAWMITMYETRKPTDRWSILPPYFQMTLFECESNRKARCYFDGSMKPVPPIADVDEVYVPLNIPRLHWFLGVFNLRDETFTIYDSLSECASMAMRRTEVVCKMNVAFDVWLRINGYYADKPLKMSLPFKMIYPDKVPQQSGGLGDCGIWVCIFQERLIKKQPIFQDEDTAVVAKQMRQRLTVLFYESLLPENFDIVSTSNKMQNDSDHEG
ncbi:putative Ulp1 protease family catalytic domain, papain-like cysteine peptidase superfamily [Helianthus annuus]|nr:putative Ulp1 protease family catalytic domain, papain-like cysteine peptidase superfamily [Helianthus annuus]